MSMGIPVVASNVDSMPEVISDGGLLCNVNDTRCFLDSVKELVNSPDYIMELGARLRP